MKVEIERIKHSDKQTLGELSVFTETSNIVNHVFQCKTLELPWLANKPYISCIPPGTYPVERRHSQRFKDHFIILNVPGRSLILVHPGNFNTQTKGCILVGSTFSDINRDGHQDVVNSRETMLKLLEKLPAKFQLTIK